MTTPHGSEEDGSSNGKRNRLKILFLPPPPHREHPWREDIIQAIDSRHLVRVWDRNLPLAPQFKDVDIVVDASGSTPTREMADLASSAKLWQLQSVGYDNFDLDYWAQKNIAVANCPGLLSAIAVAECALMHMLMVGRYWRQTQLNLQNQVFYMPMGHELENRSLGLVGFGASARELGRKAKAFNMRIDAIDLVSVSAAEKAEFGLRFAGYPGDLDKLLAESDYVSLHLPLNQQTRHTMGTSQFRLMKSSAILINVARGGLVDQDALYEALVAGELAGAGLDVFDGEPIDPQHPLLKLPNVIATPHIAGNTMEISQRRAHFAANNIERIASQETPQNLIGVRASVLK